MSLKQVLPTGEAIFVCPGCGEEFLANLNNSSGMLTDEIMQCVYNSVRCRACIQKAKEAEKARDEAERKARLAETLDVRMLKAGFGQKFCQIEKPFVRTVAEWFWRNRYDNIVASGATGTGKTSSVALVIRQMLSVDFLNVAYFRWQSLQSAYIKSITEDGDNEYRFFERLDNLDYLIVDELIGKKGNAKLTPSGQDLLFNLIDGAYSQSRKTKIWILGNFYAGALDRVIDDPLPTKRRLQECFKIAFFETDKPVDTSLRIFNTGD